MHVECCVPPCRNGRQQQLNRRAKTIEKNGIKIKYNFKIRGWRRGHNILKTSEEKEGEEKEKDNKSLFEVKGMPFSVGSRISLIMSCWNTIQWSLSMEARAIRQAVSVTELGKKRTCLLMLTAPTEVCRSSQYSARTQFLFHLQPLTDYWLLLPVHTAHTLTL